MADSDLRNRFLARAGLPDNPSVWEIVEAVRAIPYSRPAELSPAGVVQEWKGTCSTKHSLLAELLSDRPIDLRFVHRVYHVDRAAAAELFGERAAAAVPNEGLVDVHTYLVATLEGRDVKIDATFPALDVWDGRSDMPLACGDGTDYPVEGDPWAMKEELVATHCDPAVRERFIAALAGR